MSERLFMGSPSHHKRFDGKKVLVQFNFAVYAAAIIAAG